MNGMTFRKTGGLFALLAVLLLAGCATGYQYRAVASGGDYYLADEVADPYYVAPYGTLGYGWPGGWYGNVGLGFGFGNWYGTGGFYRPFYRPYGYLPGLGYGYRYPYHYRPRHPAPRVVERPQQRPVLPPRGEWRNRPVPPRGERREWIRERPYPPRGNPDNPRRWRRQGDAVVSADGEAIPAGGWRNRAPEAAGNRETRRMPMPGNRPARPADAAPRPFRPGMMAPSEPRPLRPAPSGMAPAAPARPVRSAPMPARPAPAPMAPSPKPAAVAAPPPPVRAAPPAFRRAAPAPRAPGRANPRMNRR